MSLLQDLLKSHAGLGAEPLERRFNNTTSNNNNNNNNGAADDNDSDEDKFIGVVRSSSSLNYYSTYPFSSSPSYPTVKLISNTNVFRSHYQTPQATPVPPPQPTAPPRDRSRVLSSSPRLRMPRTPCGGSQPKSRSASLAS